LMASERRKSHGRGQDREVNWQAVWVKPCRGLEPYERIVTWSQAARQGESKESLRAETGWVNSPVVGNGEEECAKPIRHYTDFLIKL